MYGYDVGRSAVEEGTDVARAVQDIDTLADGQLGQAEMFPDDAMDACLDGRGADGQVWGWSDILPYEIRMVREHDVGIDGVNGEQGLDYAHRVVLHARQEGGFRVEVDADAQFACQWFGLRWYMARI